MSLPASVRWRLETLHANKHSPIRVCATGAVATPVLLIEALTQYGKDAKLKDVKICHLHTEVRASARRFIETRCALWVGHVGQL
jgi:hypothetical protein